MTHSHEHVSARLLQLYVESELSSVQSEEIRLHTDSCASCRGRAEEIREVIETLKSDVSAGPLRPVWPHVEKGLRRHESRRLSFVSGLAAAAGLLIAVLIGARTEQSDQGTWCALAFAFSSERDIAVADFASDTPNDGRF